MAEAISAEAISLYTCTRIHMHTYQKKTTLLQCTKVLQYMTGSQDHPHHLHTRIHIHTPKKGTTLLQRGVADRDRLGAAILVYIYVYLQNYNKGTTLLQCNEELQVVIG